MAHLSFDETPIANDSQNQNETDPLDDTFIQDNSIAEQMQIEAVENLAGAVSSIHAIISLLVIQFTLKMLKYYL